MKIIATFSNNVIAYKDYNEAAMATSLSVQEIKKSIRKNIEINGIVFSKLHTDLRGKRPNKNAIPIFQLDNLGNIIAEFNSAYEAYNTTGICNINKCLNGKLKSAGGYIWKYKDELM